MGFVKWWKDNFWSTAPKFNQGSRYERFVIYTMIRIDMGRVIMPQRERFTFNSWQEVENWFRVYDSATVRGIREDGEEIELVKGEVKNGAVSWTWLTRWRPA